MLLTVIVVFTVPQSVAQLATHPPDGTASKSEAVMFVG